MRCSSSCTFAAGIRAWIDSRQAICSGLSFIQIHPTSAARNWLEVDGIPQGGGRSVHAHLALDPCKRKISRLDTVTIPLLTCAVPEPAACFPRENWRMPLPRRALDHTRSQENGNE